MRRESIEPPRQFGIEEGGEGLIFLDKLQDQEPRKQVAERFLISDEAPARRAVHDGLAIEGVLGAEQGLGLLAFFSATEPLMMT